MMASLSNLLSLSVHLFQLNEIIYLILGECDWTTFVAMSHVNRQGRARALSVMRNRLKEVFKDFMGDEDRQLFFALMRVTKAGLADALPVEIMRNGFIPSKHGQLTHLQVVVPRHTFSIWLAFLTSIGYARASGVLKSVACLMKSTTQRRYRTLKRQDSVSHCAWF